MDSSYEYSDKKEIGPSKTLQILMLFAHKFLYPSLYPEYDITEGQFATLLDLLEEKISKELEKVEKEVNLEKEEMDEDTRVKAEEQVDYLIEAGELFFDAIEEMRIYLESEEKEHLLKGIEIARKADKSLGKSLEIFEKLRETH